jgi:hypothetical protein
MSEYKLPDLKSQITSLLPISTKKTQLIKTITTTKPPPQTTEQKTISVFLSPASGMTPKGTDRGIETGTGKETLAERRERMLARIRDRNALGGGVGVDRELMGAYERGEWCISGLFMYFPISSLLLMILFPLF